MYEYQKNLVQRYRSFLAGLRKKVGKESKKKRKKGNEERVLKRMRIPGKANGVE